MTRSTQWKVWEREVAADLKGERTGPRGFGLPDVLLPDLAPECKYQQRMHLRTSDLRQAKKNARGKPWGLFLREANTGHRVVVMFEDYYHEYPQPEIRVLFETRSRSSPNLSSWPTHVGRGWTIPHHVGIFLVTGFEDEFKNLVAIQYKLFVEQYNKRVEEIK